MAKRERKRKMEIILKKKKNKKRTPNKINEPTKWNFMFHGAMLLMAFADFRW